MDDIVSLARAAGPALQKVKQEQFLKRQADLEAGLWPPPPVVKAPPPVLSKEERAAERAAARKLRIEEKAEAQRVEIARLARVRAEMRAEKLARKESDKVWVTQKAAEIAERLKTGVKKPARDSATRRTIAHTKIKSTHNGQVFRGHEGRGG